MTRQMPSCGRGTLSTKFNSAHWEGFRLCIESFYFELAVGQLGPLNWPTFFIYNLSKKTGLFL